MLEPPPTPIPLLTPSLASLPTLPQSRGSNAVELAGALQSRVDALRRQALASGEREEEVGRSFSLPAGPPQLLLHCPHASSLHDLLSFPPQPANPTPQPPQVHRLHAELRRRADDVASLRAQLALAKADARKLSQLEQELREAEAALRQEQQRRRELEELAERELEALQAAGRELEAAREQAARERAAREEVNAAARGATPGGEPSGPVVGQVLNVALAAGGAATAEAAQAELASAAEVAADVAALKDQLRRSERRLGTYGKVRGRRTLAGECWEGRGKKRCVHRGPSSCFVGLRRLPCPSPVSSHPPVCSSPPRPASPRWCPPWNRSCAGCRSGRRAWKSRRWGRGLPACLGCFLPSGQETGRCAWRKRAHLGCRGLASKPHRSPWPLPAP